MAFIKVGIQVVRISQVSKDENNNVNILFEQGQEVDPLKALMGDGDFGGVESSNVRIFALKNESYGTTLTGFRLVEHINKFRMFFEQILLIYFPKDQVAFTTMYDGVDVGSIDDVKKLGASDVARVGNNIVNYFISKMNEADKNKEVRVKFHRSSETKNFITLKTDMARIKMGDKNNNDKMMEMRPALFIEDAIIPEASSKLKYSNFEKGLDKDGNKTSWDKSDPSVVKADATPNDGGDSDLPF